MSIFSGFTRRKFLQGCGGRRRRGRGGTRDVPARRSRGAGGAARQEALQGRRAHLLPGFQLAARPALALAACWMNEAGVGIKSREMYDGGDAVAKILPQLLARKPALRLGAVSLACSSAPSPRPDSSNPWTTTSPSTKAARTTSTGSCRPTASSTPSGTARPTA